MTSYLVAKALPLFSDCCFVRKKLISSFFPQDHFKSPDDPSVASMSTLHHTQVKPKKPKENQRSKTDAHQVGLLALPASGRLNQSL